MKLIAQFVAVVKDAPTHFALKAYRWLLRVHAPVDAGAPDYTWCETCRKPWPCSVWLTASNEIEAIPVAPPKRR